MDKRIIAEKYFSMVYHLALSRTKSKVYAQDITQDVFLKYIQIDKAFENEEHIKAWLLRVTINTSKSMFTSAYFKKIVPLKDEIVFDTKEKSDVYYAVLDLPQKYRTAIHLFYYEDLSIAQISKYLKMKESTVKSHLHRGREMLKMKLKGGIDFV